jgi:2-methylfumaryl-CoA isomerase
LSALTHWRRHPEFIRHGVHSPARSAPALGEHTAEVLAARLGMGADEIDTLVESGVVAT